MPIGLLVPDGNDAQGRAQFEAIANGDGAVLGREFEIADLLRYIKREDVTNTVWLTADVHYCAAHYYDPNKAVFQDFDPFWEFVSGPLNAGAFGPNTLDNTFGPQLVFSKFPPLAEYVAGRRLPILRPGGHRQPQQGHGRRAEGHRRQTGVRPAPEGETAARAWALGLGFT